MLFVTFPAMLLALVPVVLVESYVLIRQLALSGGTAIKISAIANVASTVVGMPVAWFVLVIMQLASGGGAAFKMDSTLAKLLAVTWQAPWLIPHRSDIQWMVPAATLTLLVPFFFVSWLIEYQVAKRMVASPAPSRLSSAVRNANLGSYGLLALAVVAKLLFFRDATFLI